MAITLVTLVSMFITLFLHQYRQWEANLREKVRQSNLKFILTSLETYPWQAEQIANRPDSEDDDEEDYSYNELDPMLKKKLLQVYFLPMKQCHKTAQTRRKSVAFSVCVVDRDNMTFDLDRKKVI